MLCIPLYNYISLYTDFDAYTIYHCIVTYNANIMDPLYSKVFAQDLASFLADCFWDPARSFQNTLRGSRGVAQAKKDQILPIGGPGLCLS